MSWLSLYLRGQSIRFYQFALMSLLLPFATYSQGERLTTNNLDNKKSSPAYLDIAMGLNVSSFRDFATSPLTYSGTPIHFSLGHIDFDHQRESNMTFLYAFGKYKNRFNDLESISKVNTISLNYLELFELSSLSSSRLNLKLGGQFSATANIRKNGVLLNNGTGVDIIANLLGTVKGTLHLRKERTFSGMISIGAINSSYRNGFAYSGQSALTNQGSLFDRYRLSFLRGYRLITNWDYTFYLKNKNAIRLSYHWDAYRTRGNYDEFEMAIHTIKVALLFNLK